MADDISEEAERCIAQDTARKRTKPACVQCGAPSVCIDVSDGAALCNVHSVERTIGAARERTKADRINRLRTRLSGATGNPTRVHQVLHGILDLLADEL